MCATAETIKACASEKLQLNRCSDDLSLVEIKSNGERIVYKDSDVSIPTALSLNGRIFVSPKDHLDALVRKAFKKVTSKNSNFFVKIFRHHYLNKKW